jgi:threonine dehydratase
VPSGAPEVKRNGITALGATIDTTQPHYDAAMDAAKAFARERGATFINPCLGEMLLAGQGTVALEILGEVPELASLVVNVGGGGLLGGCGALVRAVAPRVRIIGAQSEKTAAMSRSLAAGRLVEIENEPTLADGLAGQIDDEAFDIGTHALDDIVTLTEREVAEAIGFLWREHKQRVEGAGACATGALWKRKIASLPTPAAIVVSGGNIDDSKLEAILASS